MIEREELEKNISCTANFRYKQTNGIGIALGGGLARGLAHIGVFKALIKHGINPEIVSGTSIGAVVGGCYLANKLDAIEEWALSLNRKRILSYLDFKVKSSGVIGGKRLHKLLKVHFKDLTIEDLNHPYVAVATNLLTGHEVWLQSGDLIEAMSASFALPGVFPPVERNDRFLIDGALVNPVPVAPCQAMGARLTIAVNLHADLIAKAAHAGKRYQTVAGFDLFDKQDVPEEEQKKYKSAMTTRLFRRPDDEAPSMFGVLFSALNIMQDRLTRLRSASDPADIYINPQIGHIGVAEFERARDLIGEGESAATKVIPLIKEAMPILLPSIDRD